MRTVSQNRGDTLRDPHLRVVTTRRGQPRRAGLYLELPAQSSSVPHVRRLVGDLAERMGATEERIADIRLAVTEACANVVVHAYGSSGGRLTVEAMDRGDDVVVTISDTGRGLTCTSAHPGLGQGLSLIGSLSDDLQIESGAGDGTHVRLYFRLGDGRRPAA
jgi:anti-sigma regulatory factor (Ser/Thr protein kinase)